MTESTADATLELLCRMRAENVERLDKIDKNIGLLAEGFINMRVQMKHLIASLDTVAMSTAGHGLQLSDLDARIARIEKHLTIVT